MNTCIAKIETSGFSTEIFLHDDNDRPADLECDLVVCDNNTSRYSSGSKSVLLKAGEEFKNWQSICQILDRAFEYNLARDSVFLGLGGGVVCDMTAFASSLYLRGCKTILVPSTLLAMVDASIGGKTGIDWNQYKNMVGTFYPANQIHIYPSLLSTLDDRQYFCGMGEVLKHAMLDSGEIWSYLDKNFEAIKKRDPGVLPELIRLNACFKVSVVNSDLRESGARAFLNLGHTFGHALESVTGFQDWSHGEGVVWGLAVAMKSGLKLGLTDPAWAESVFELLARFGYRTKAAGVSPEALLSAMKVDKKRKAGKIRFVLQKKQADTQLVEMDDATVLSVLNEMT